MNRANCNISLAQCSWLDLNMLRDRTILVTGATGLVGVNLLRSLVSVKESRNLKILALVRNPQKARRIFADISDQVELVVGDVMQLPRISQKIDYVIHGASITSSRAFVEQPVETILTSVQGLCNILELCREKQVSSMVYLSSMEAYGTVEQDDLLTEDNVGYLNPLKLRSSYPESKRMCENLFVAYAKEYGVPVKIARLAQTFGPGMQLDDKRAVVQFVQSALAHENISIKASGQSARMYLYTFDAATALVTILLKGDNGVAYNVANKDSYSSIQELAEKICQIFSPQSRVCVNTGSEEERAIYPPDTYLRLDTTALEALGWSPMVSLEDSLRFLAAGMGNVEKVTDL